MGAHVTLKNGVGVNGGGGGGGTLNGVPSNKHSLAGAVCYDRSVAPAAPAATKTPAPNSRTTNRKPSTNGSKKTNPNFRNNRLPISSYKKPVSPSSNKQR